MQLSLALVREFFWSNVLFRSLIKLVIASLFLLPIGHLSTAQATDVYLFRGLAGVPFSVGLDDLEDKIKASGIRAETHPYTSWEQIYRKIKRRGKNVALIGHSMGALSAMSLTRKLRGSGIRVSYLGLIDIPGTGKAAPKNAPWAENYVSSQPGFGMLKYKRRDKNLVINTRVRSTVHVTIDDSPKVHDAIISAIWLADSAPGRASSSLAFAKPNTATNHGIDLVTTGSLK